MTGSNAPTPDSMTLAAVQLTNIAQELRRAADAYTQQLRERTAEAPEACAEPEAVAEPEAPEACAEPEAVAEPEAPEACAEPEAVAEPEAPEACAEPEAIAEKVKQTVTERASELFVTGSGDVLSIFSECVRKDYVPWIRELLWKFTIKPSEEDLKRWIMFLAINNSAVVFDKLHELFSFKRCHVMGTDALKNIALCGNVVILDRFCEHSLVDEKDVASVARAFAVAAEGGQIEVLTYLHNRFKAELGVASIDEAIAQAARAGQLEIVKFLYPFCADLDYIVFEGAARCGQLRIMEFLHENGFRRTKAHTQFGLLFRDVCESAHLPVIQFMWDHFEITKAEVTAANWRVVTQSTKNKHVGVLKWLKETVGLTVKECPDAFSSVFKRAAEDGQVDVLECLHTTFALTVSDALLRYAAGKRNERVLRCLCTCYGATPAIFKSVPCDLESLKAVAFVLEQQGVIKGVTILQ